MDPTAEAATGTQAHRPRVLLWYAFDSYLRLQDTPTGHVAHSLIETVAQAVPAPE